MNDPINPQHYKRLPVEAIEIIEAAIANAPWKRAAYLHGQVLKYILRCWNKNGIEDLRKAKWYLDRLIDSFDTDSDSVVEESSKKENRQPTKPTLNSDIIPEGYRKLGNSMSEQRQPGDLRWSVAENRYIPISGDEIGYANRDNWAACRKVEQEAKPPDGWRFLNRGEVIRKGDQGFKNGLWYSIEPTMIGMALQSHWRPILRRNRFKIGEKVVECVNNRIGVVQREIGDRKYVAEYEIEMLDTKRARYFFPYRLAPYIEEAK